MRAHGFCAGISGEPDIASIDTIRPVIDLGFLGSQPANARWRRGFG
jgi:hypothetical protein